MSGRRRRVSRLARAAAALALAVLAAGAARAHYVDLDDALVAPGTLTFGVALIGRPFAQRVDGELLGFEVEAARAVAAAHGLELRVVALARDRLRAALAAREVDAVSTFALEPPPADALHGEGADAGDVATVPYLVLGDHLMVLRGNPFRIREAGDLAGRTVAVTQGTSAERFAHRLDAALAGRGAPRMNVHSFPLDRFTHFPVSMGHAAGYFVSTLRAVGISRDPASRTTLVEGVFAPAREVGFGVPRGNGNLHHAVEHAVAALVATGRFAALVEAHGLPPELDPYRR